MGEGVQVTPKTAFVPEISWRNNSNAVLFQVATKTYVHVNEREWIIQ